MKRWFFSYGMTETCGTCTKTFPFDPTCSGTIGPPQPVNEIKLVDVPSMGYTSEDKPHPRGELCVRGVNCFTAYHKGTYMSRERRRRCANTATDEKNTKNTLDSEGWLHSGDVAEVDSFGRFKVIDRIKVRYLILWTGLSSHLVY